METPDYSDRYGSLPHAVAVVDLLGRFIYLNPCYESVLGYAFDELIGESVDRVHSQRNSPGLGTEILEATLRDGHWNGRLWNRARSGEEVWIDCHTQALRDSSGRPFAFAGWVRRIRGPQVADEQFLATLAEASALVTRRMDADDLLREMNLLLRRGLAIDRVGIWRREGGFIRGTWGTDPRGNLADERGLIEGSDQFATVRVANSGVPEILPDGLHVVLPIRVNGETIGIISVDNVLSGNPIPNEMIAPLSLFADYVGIGLRNAQMLDEVAAATAGLERRATELQTLLQVGLDLPVEWVPERLFQEIALSLADLLNVPRVDLFLARGNDLEAVAGVRRDDDGSVHTPLGTDDDLSPDCIQSIRAAIVRSPSGGTAEAAHAVLDVHFRCADANETRTGLIVPIPAGDRPLGALVGIETRGPRQFSDEEVHLASHLAAAVAVALRNAAHISEIERLNSELRRALTVERELAEERSRLSHLEGILQTVRTVNHEINNPLQIVVGNAQMLEMRLQYDEAALGRVSRLLEGCRRIADVSAQLSHVVRGATCPSPAGDRLDLSAATDLQAADELPFPSIGYRLPDSV